MDFNISELDQLSIAGLGAQNDFNSLILDGERDQSQTDSMGLNNVGLSLNYLRTINPAFSVELKAAHTYYSYDYRYFLTDLDDKRNQNEGLKKNGIQDSQAQLAGIWKLNKNRSLKSVSYTHLTLPTILLV